MEQLCITCNRSLANLSVALRLIGGKDAEGTSKFADMMDNFFDCLNVHNYTMLFILADFKKPYTSADEIRLKVFDHM